MEGVGGKPPFCQCTLNQQREVRKGLRSSPSILPWQSTDRLKEDPLTICNEIFQEEHCDGPPSPRVINVLWRQWGLVCSQIFGAVAEFPLVMSTCWSDIADYTPHSTRQWCPGKMIKLVEAQHKL